jgi:hypothetical protein
MPKIDIDVFIMNLSCMDVALYGAAEPHKPNFLKVKWVYNVLLAFKIHTILFIS